MAIEWVNVRCKACGVRLSSFELDELGSHCIDCKREQKEVGNNVHSTNKRAAGGAKASKSRVYSTA